MKNQLQLQSNYTTEKQKHNDKIKLALVIVELILIIGIAYVVISALQMAGLAEEQTRWVMCKPTDFINVRETPEKHGIEAGYLECGDNFKTDGKTRNGYLHVLNWGEIGDGWIFAGYVVSEKPEQIFENYYCCAKNRVACRRWIDGPKSQYTPWLKNCGDVLVFYIADGWAITSRGFIQAEWLEVG